jgi:hypothetical protein
MPKEVAMRHSIRQSGFAIILVWFVSLARAGGLSTAPAPETFPADVAVALWAYTTPAVWGVTPDEMNENAEESVAVH